MDSLLNIDNFHSVELTLIDSILPIVLKRLDDKPKVVEKATELGLYIVSNTSIRGFPLIAECLFTELQMDSKWKCKLGSLKILGQYIDRVEKFDRDLL